MALHQETITLPPAAPGVARQLSVLRYVSAEPGPKAYIQAALHGDEIPALLVAQHLRERLTALDAAGKLRGEIILLPYANPIGLSQFLQGWHLGRYELDSGANFNRDYPDLFEPVAAAVAGKLFGDAAANVALIRAAIRTALAGLPRAQSENTALKRALHGMACDADVVLDLHCDYEATMHLYIGTPLWPAAADLAACMQSPVNLLSEDSGGAAFDEACSRIWWRLARHFPNHPIPPACCAATVELRGERDVSDAFAAEDASGIIQFLALRGFVNGPPPLLPASLPTATDLDAVDSMNAPLPGVLIWSTELGSEVKAGDVLGHLLDPATGIRHPIVARTEGLLFARRGHRFARPDQWIAKIAGRQPLAWRKPGALLSS